MKTTPTTGGESPGAAAELPVVGYRYGTALLWADDAPVGEPDCEALTPQAPAQAQLDALREEVARLTKERDAAIEDAKEIRARWNDAENEFAALKAQPTDVDALMALADAWVVAAIHAALAANCGNTTLATPNAAREALRAKLAARKEAREPMTPDEIHDRITELKDLLP